MLKQQVTAQEEGGKFKELANDLLPLIKQIEDVLKKHGVTAMASMTVDVTTGYLSFSTHASLWEMLRINNEHLVNLQYKYQEVFALEEKCVCGEQEEE